LLVFLTRRNRKCFIFKIIHICEDGFAGADTEKEAFLQACVVNGIESFGDLRILASTFGSKQGVLLSLLGTPPSEHLLAVAFGKDSVDHKAVISASYRVSCHKDAVLAPPASKAPPPSKRVRRADTGELESRVLVSHRYPSEKAINQLKSRIMNCALSSAPSSFTSIADIPKVDNSLRESESQARKELVSGCFAMLKVLGPKSPRYAEIYSASGVDESVMAIQEDLFVSRATNVSVLRNHLKDSERLLAWCVAIHREVDDLSPMKVASFIRDQLPRGKSVPSRVLSTLVWFQRVFDIPLFVADPIVVAQSKVVSSKTQLEISAELPTADMVIGMESLVFDAPTVPLAVYAGVCCALCHGVLRCSDVLHSEGLSLSEDAVMGTCWKMKKKAAPVPWAALRMGLSGRDWAAEWLWVLRSVDLPGGDFVTLGINASATDFVPRVARYYDVANAMRMLLTLPPISLSP